jgi:hypothetical protein
MVRDMPLSFLQVAVCCGLLAVGAVSAAPVSFAVSGEPEELVQDAGRFGRFGREVAATADRMLAAAPDAATRKLLLGLRVHLALYFREGPLALKLAEQIRASQTDGGERAHSGLTTQALVRAEGDPIRFEKEFARLLSELPRDAGVRAALVRARQKIEELSRENLLAEIRENVAPRLARGEPCTLELADQIVRAGHRLQTILPMRAAMLRAYSAAIARQD